MKRILATILMFSSNFIFAMDASTSDEATRLGNIHLLKERGYIASTDFAKTTGCEPLLADLAALARDPSFMQHVSKNGEDRGHRLELLVKKSSSCKDGDEISISALTMSNQPQPLPDCLEKLVINVMKLIDDGNYLLNVILINEKYYLTPNNNFTNTYWHQDIFNEESLLFRDNIVRRYILNFRYLYFLEISRKGFGNSPLKIGSTSKINLTQDGNSATAVRDDEDKVTLLEKIASGPSAGYAIDQQFDKADQLLVHTSPLVCKEGLDSERLKVIVRVLPID